MQNFIYNLKNSYLLFLTAMIWGLTFLFQKTAMENLDPYYFTGFRFLLGTLVLFPFFYRRFFKLEKKEKFKIMQYGSVAGIILFGGTILQQIGLVYSTVLLQNLLNYTSISVWAVVLDETLSSL